MYVQAIAVMEIIILILVPTSISKPADYTSQTDQVRIDKLQSENEYLIKRCCELLSKLQNHNTSLSTLCMTCSCNSSCMKLSEDDKAEGRSKRDLDELEIFEPDDYNPGSILEQNFNSLNQYEELDATTNVRVNDDDNSKTNLAASLFLTKLFARFRDDAKNNLSTSMIRSFFNQATVEEMRRVASQERNECLLKGRLEPMLCLRMSYLLKFHVSTILRHDDIKKAEIIIGEMLKLYRERHIHQSDVEVSVYEISELPDNEDLSIKRRLLSAKIMDASDSGTFISIDITRALKLWIQNHRNSSHLIQVQMQSEGELYDIQEEDDERKQEEIINQPLLVVYSNSKNRQGKVRKTEIQEFLRPYVPNIPPFQEAENEELLESFESHVRKRRSNHIQSRLQPCHLEKMYVHFHNIGYDKWIKAPGGYQAGKCVGRCDPLFQSDISRHSIIQYWMSITNPDRHKRPCCVPTKLSPISLIYSEQDSIVYDTQYQGMRVERCGCR